MSVRAGGQNDFDRLLSELLVAIATHVYYRVAET
jgi:hypothetical protein